MKKKSKNNDLKIRFIIACVFFYLVIISAIEAIALLSVYIDYVSLLVMIPFMIISIILIKHKCKKEPSVMGLFKSTVIPLLISIFILAIISIFINTPLSPIVRFLTDNSIRSIIKGSLWYSGVMFCIIAMIAEFIVIKKHKITSYYFLIAVALFFFQIFFFGMILDGQSSFSPTIRNKIYQNTNLEYDKWNDSYKNDFAYLSPIYGGYKIEYDVRLVCSPNYNLDNLEYKKYLIYIEPFEKLNDKLLEILLENRIITDDITNAINDDCTIVDDSINTAIWHPNTKVEITYNTKEEKLTLDIYQRSKAPEKF